MTTGSREPAFVAVRTCLPSVLVPLSAGLLLSCAPPALPAPPSTTIHTCSASVLKPTRSSSTHRHTRTASASSFGLYPHRLPCTCWRLLFGIFQPFSRFCLKPRLRLSGPGRAGPACQTICFLPNPSLPAVHLVGSLR